MSALNTFFNQGWSFPEGSLSADSLQQVKAKQTSNADNQLLQSILMQCMSAAPRPTHSLSSYEPIKSWSYPQNAHRQSDCCETSDLSSRSPAPSSYPSLDFRFKGLADSATLQDVCCPNISNDFHSFPLGLPQRASTQSRNVALHQQPSAPHMESAHESLWPGFPLVSAHDFTSACSGLDSYDFDSSKFPSVVMDMNTFASPDHPQGTVTNIVVRTQSVHSHPKPLPTVPSFSPAERRDPVSIAPAIKHARLQQTNVSSNRLLCPHCPKGFEYPSGLIRHVRIHTGEAPFQCDVCSRCFKQRGTLLAHMRVHSGETPFKCPREDCEERFRHRSTLRRHLKKSHGANNSSVE